MPRDATTTRDRLLRAGAHLFARKGVDGAPTAEIVALAGQANDSAVQYHFGSRLGLLVAIVDKHMRRMEEQRKAVIDRLVDADLGTIVAAVVEPLAAELGTPEGRDFLRVAAQLAGNSGVRTHDLPDPIASTALAGQLALLEDRCRAVVGERFALERMAAMITMLTAALAERARRVDDGLPALLTHDEYVADLVTMLAAAVGAPRTGSSRRSRSTGGRPSPDGVRPSGR